LKRVPEWQEAEQDIRKRRYSFSKVSDSTAQSLAQAMPHEIDYVYASWNRRHDEGLNIATKILAALEGGSDLQPYRAFWHHQAATSAFLAWKNSESETFKLSAISYLDQASANSSHLTWLGRLRSKISGQAEGSISKALPLQEWFLEIEALLQKWKIRGGNYAKQVSKVQKDIENKEAKAFERGLALLGQMLGAKTHQWTDDGAPDGLWIFGNWQAFVFEAKTHENPDGGISLDTVTQARRHEERVRADNLIPHFVPCSTIVISPRTKIHKLAVPHTEDITYISHDEVIKLFNDAAMALERVRSSAAGNTEEALLENALQNYRQQSVDMQHIKEKLLSRKLRELPQD
jgi:hypothetical protein